MMCFGNTGADVRQETVIITRLECRGKGTSQSDPVRRITQIWSLKGELIAESDPFKDSREGAK